MGEPGSGTAISADGRFIARRRVGLGRPQAFYGELGPGNSRVFSSPSEALGLSADGRIVVGAYQDTAYRWDAFMANPTPIGAGTRSAAKAISADGSVIVAVGILPNDSRGFQAFVNRNGTTLGLGDFANRPDRVDSAATAVSPNGLIVVGTASDGQRSFGFRWTSETGMVKLAAGLTPQSVTDSGIILGLHEVIGSSLGDGELGTLLTGCGISLQSAWTLEAADMTPNGRTIVGSVKTAAFPWNRAFIAKLP